jgi:hypothetical protein
MDAIAEYGRQILALIVVFSLLGFTVWKLGRHRGSVPLAQLTGGGVGQKGRTAARVLEPVERLVLTPQHTLHVLRFRDREILVTTHPHGCSLLDGEPEKPGLTARGAGA